MRRDVGVDIISIQRRDFNPPAYMRRDGQPLMYLGKRYNFNPPAYMRRDTELQR